MYLTGPEKIFQVFKELFEIFAPLFDGSPEIGIYEEVAGLWE